MKSQIVCCAMLALSMADARAVNATKPEDVVPAAAPPSTASGLLYLLPQDRVGKQPDSRVLDEMRVSAESSRQAVRVPEQCDAGESAGALSAPDESVMDASRLDPQPGDPEQYVPAVSPERADLLVVKIGLSTSRHLTAEVVPLPLSRVIATTAAICPDQPVLDAPNS